MSPRLIAVTLAAASLVAAGLAPASLVGCNVQASLGAHDAATLVSRGNLYARTTGARDVRGDAFVPPYAYALDAAEDVASVVDVIHGAGIATKVARLVPLAVVKG